MFLLAQGADPDFQLLPDTAELIWGALVFFLLLGVLLTVVVLILRAASRGGRGQEARLRRIEERLDELEQR